MSYAISGLYPVETQSAVFPVTHWFLSSTTSAQIVIPPSPALQRCSFTPWERLARGLTLAVPLALSRGSELEAYMSRHLDQLKPASHKRLLEQTGSVFILSLPHRIPCIRLHCLGNSMLLLVALHSQCNRILRRSY